MNDPIRKPARPAEFDIRAPVRRRRPGCTVPLTELQLDYWGRISRSGEPKNSRLRAAALRVLGPWDLGVVRESIDATVQRHESLRTKIVTDAGTPTHQHIADSSEGHFDVIDASMPSCTEHDARQLASEFLSQDINLCKESMFAARVLRRSATEHIFLAGLDHMIGDGVSCGLLTREILTSYDQLSRGLPPSLTELPIQFADYAVWEHQTREARRAKDAAHWAPRIAYAPDIQIPASPSSTEMPHSSSAVLTLPLGKVLSDGLRGVASREDTLLPIVVLTTYLVAMAHWCRESDWRVFFVTHGRHGRPELKSMIGCLATAFHLRVDVDPRRSLIEVLRHAREEFSAACEHQDFIPPPPSEINRAQVFNWGGLVSYTARWSVDQQRSALPGLQVQPFRAEVRAEHKFYPFFADTPAGVVATVNYRASEVAPEAIEQLGRNMRIVAEALCQQPLAPCNSLPLSS